MVNIGMKRILVTGGAGFIGSHTCKALAAKGYEPIVFDNLSAGHRKAVKWGPLVVGDIRDGKALAATFREHRPDAVIHFAAHAYVGESTEAPAKYYDNNVSGTLSLLNAMHAADVNTLVFSSSCATYGIPGRVPITEDTPLLPVNPYGWTKRIAEQILSDYAAAYGLAFVALRYFNAAGADPDGELGEWHDPETHLIPRAMMAAAGSIQHLDIFGTDYDTPDGTCIRDYVHVMDLADAHVRALSLFADRDVRLRLNVGTGKGYSIGEIVKAIETVTGRKVPTVASPRRAGDPPVLVADPKAAMQALGFEPRHSDLDTIVRTAWPVFARGVLQA